MICSMLLPRMSKPHFCASMLIVDNSIRSSFVINLKRQKELERRRRLNGVDLRAMDQMVMAIFGMSLRNAQRYLHATDAPPEIQAAFRRNDILLNHAARVGSLNPDEQQEVAMAIRGITHKSEIREIIAIFIRKYGVRPRSPRIKRHTPKAMAMLEKFAGQLAEVETDQLHGPTVAKHLPALKKLQTTVANLITVSDAQAEIAQTLRDPER